MSDGNLYEKNDGEKVKLKEDPEEAATADPDFDETVDSKARFINGGKGLDETQVDVTLTKSNDESFAGLGKDELMKYADDPYWVRVRLLLFIFFWVAWVGMLVAAIVIIVVAPRCPYRPPQKWYNKDVVYQAYPKSFQDTNADGVGDLKGIEDRLSYFEELGIRALWINSIYKSPQTDSGYGVINHTEIYSKFGPENFGTLRKKFFNKGIKLILDFIPNHTHKSHPWFQMSRNKTGKYTNYYIWNSSPQGSTPNNWLNAYGDPAWEYDDIRKEHYLHQFLVDQPDLNLRNPDVQDELEAILKFWIEKDVYGFHIVGASHLVEDNSTADEPLNQNGKADGSFTKNHPENVEMIQKWRMVIDEASTKPGRERVLFATLSTDSINDTLLYYGDEDRKGLHFAIVPNLMEIGTMCGGSCVYDAVDPALSVQNLDNWLGWKLDSENDIRFASRVDSDIIQGMHALQLLLPGTAINYYGDELGMKDQTDITWEQTQDQLALDKGKAIFDSNSISRDPHRTPMIWNGKKNAGFSNSNSTWLPVGPISYYETQNLQAQKATFAGHTTVELFTEMVTLRDEPSFQFGQFSASIVDDDIFSFIRHAEGFPSYLVAINFGVSSKSNLFYDRPEGLVSKMAEVVLHTAGKVGEFAKGTEVSLEKYLILNPGEVVVLKLK